MKHLETTAVAITRPLPASVPTGKGAEGWQAPTFVLRARLLVCLLLLARSALRWRAAHCLEVSLLEVSGHRR